MAETVRAATGEAVAEPGRVREGLRAYGLIAAMWVRSTMAYRASFALTTFTNFAVTGLDFVAILLMFSRVDALGGFSLAEIAFLYGLSSLAFGLADMLIGSIERLGRRVRDGTLDTLLVRPAPVLAQVAADRFALRRLGRVTQGLLVLGFALSSLDIDWTPLKLLLMPGMVLSGGAIFCAVFIAGAAFQFVAQDASEVSERVHVRRGDAVAVPAGGVRAGTGARGDLRAAAGLRQLAARVLCAGAAVSAGPARVGGVHVAAGGGGLLCAGRAGVAGGASFVPEYRELTELDGVERGFIELDGVEKVFDVRKKTGFMKRERRQVRAVDSISFRVERGEMVGYIGPNGAGKSTTIKMLTGILTPSAGRLRVAGIDPSRERTRLAHRIGVVFGQRTTLWWDLPLVDSYRLMHRMYRIPDARYRHNLDRLVELLALDDLLDVPVRQLSLGQRMRGDIAAALLHDPEVLYLDEPTIGLDVVSKSKVREFLREMNAERGTTVLLTTHDLQDIEQLCKRVMVIDHGRLMYDGPLAGLHEAGESERTLVVDLERELPPIDAPAPARVVRVEGPRQWLAFPAAESAAPLVARIAAEYPLVDLSVREPDIEAVIAKMLHSMGDTPKPPPERASA